MTRKPLHVPHGSRHVPPEEWAPYPGPVPATWHQAVQGKGFTIDRRVRDRSHVVLECDLCGGHTAQKRETLFSAGAPGCGACQMARREANAKAAGFLHLGRDEKHRHYDLYELPCGHVRSLQKGQVERLAREGAAPGWKGYHCPTCHEERIKALAASRGWRLAGADPRGNPNYRVFDHIDCGHRQRVAIANMETGRFDCGGCGKGWQAAPSALYLMRFRVPEVGRFVKLGMSRDPWSRLRYQFRLRRDVEADLIHEVAIPTGQVALRIERALHRQLRAAHPGAVIPRADLADWINVTSEIYAAELEPVIRRLLEGIEAGLEAKADADAKAEAA